MKTFLLDAFNRYTRFSEKLDVKTTLCNKTWWVFNDSGEKEIYIFQEDGSLIVSVNGQVTPASWKYISTNKSLIISTNKQNVMLQPAFIDKTIFSLRLDGTNDYAFLIDEENMSTVQFRTLSDIKKYIGDKVAIAELQEKEQVKIEEERRKHLLAVSKENARIEEEKKRAERKAIEIERENQLRLLNDKTYLELSRKLELAEKREEKFKGYWAISIVVLIITFPIGYLLRESQSYFLYVIGGIFSLALLLFFFFGFVMQYNEQRAMKYRMKLNDYK